MKISKNHNKILLLIGIIGIYLLNFIFYRFLVDTSLDFVSVLVGGCLIPIFMSAIFLLFYENISIKKWILYTFFWMLPIIFVTADIHYGIQDGYVGILLIPILMLFGLYIISTPFYFRHQSNKLK